ncbi:MAG TPA: class I SAM-dependent methyltransferase [Acidimicrobiales bacterium]|nr:class I SAM-dependent methyltransferase [Acidimicrobiales bacterium]
MEALEPEILEYYQRGREAGRLAGEFPSGPLELARTQELILRHLPPAPLDVLDVGGGPGVYAAWLAERGYRVRLIDPVPLHVEQARATDRGVSADVGDARELAEPDASADAVLLMGPLYHLVDGHDRLQALAEARRVLRPGGLLVAAAISRWAALLDLLVRLDRLHEPEVADTVCSAVEDGVFRGHRPGLFTTAYMHRPGDLALEIERSGFPTPVIYNVEGPGFMVSDFGARWSDPDRRAALLRAARMVETEPELAGASSHLVAVSVLPGPGAS